MNTARVMWVGPCSLFFFGGLTVILALSLSSAVGSNWGNRRLTTICIACVCVFGVCVQAGEEHARARMARAARL